MPRETKWCFRDIEEDMQAMACIQDREEIWAYVLKGGRLLFKEPYRFAVSVARWGEPGEHGVAAEDSDLASAVVSAGGDSMLVVHNHPGTQPESGQDIRGISLMPSGGGKGGDAKAARVFKKFFDRCGLGIRFLIATADGVAEFNGSGRVIRMSRNSRYYPSPEEKAAGIKVLK